MITWIRRNLTMTHAAVGYAIFTALQAVLLVWRLAVPDREPLWIGLLAVTVVLGVGVTIVFSVRYELRDEALRTRSWVSRSDRPWSEIAAVEVDWRRPPDEAAATVSLADGRTRQSGQWNRLAFPERAAERDELRRELERTAGAAGVEVTVHDPNDDPA